MSISLPAKLSADALHEFELLLGSERVLSSEEDLLQWRDPFQHSSWEEYTASAVVMPETVEEVQEVVRIAGRPACRCGPLPGSQQRLRRTGTAGQGLGDRSLRRMNRVLEINEELGYAVVEPGVRWFDLYEAIKAGSHRLMLSIADVGWGSVIGNTLDNGITYMPYGVDMGMQCGMEVVLAGGEVMRTGMGAMPGNRSWHVYKRGLGPTPDQLFMQSNFGIVTKMGVWLMPYPEVYMPIWVRVWKDDELAPLVDMLRRLMLDDTIRMVPQVMNTVLYGSIFTRRDQWWQGEGPMPEATIDRMARELDIGRWLLRAALYGDEAVVDHRFEKVKREFGRIEGAEVWAPSARP